MWKENTGWRVCSLTSFTLIRVWVSECTRGRLCYIQHKEFMSRWMACTACRNWMTRCNNVDTRRRAPVESDASALVSCGDWETDSADKMQRANAEKKTLNYVRLCTCFAYFERRQKLLRFSLSRARFCLCQGFIKVYFATLGAVFCFVFVCPAPAPHPHLCKHSQLPFRTLFCYWTSDIIKRYPSFIPDHVKISTTSDLLRVHRSNFYLSQRSTSTTASVCNNKI